MSRSNYGDVEDNWALIRWRGAVAAGIKSKRGQQLLQEMADAMDAMPEKVLISHDLVDDGNFCALGVLGVKRGLDLRTIDPEESESVAKAFGVSEALVREVAFMNDEAGRYGEAPWERWARMRQWVRSNLLKPAPVASEGVPC